MASFFKGSCFVYWLVWLGCLAYFFSTTIYSTTYIMASKEGDDVFSILKFICFFNIIMAFVGCIFVKCSITHVLCAALYILPIIGVNMALTIIGLIKVKNLTPPTADQLVQEIQDVFSKTQLYPEWLYNAQLELPCCGIYSFLDYPILFNKSDSLSTVIPKSCCNNSGTNTFDKHKCNEYLDSDLSGNTSMTPKDILDTYARNCTVVGPPKRSNDASMPYYNYSIHFKPTSDITDKVFLCGCYNDFNLMASGLYQAHFAFFIIILIASWVMAFIYLKVWCKHRGSITDSGSDHSLDIDEIDDDDISLINELELQGHTIESLPQHLHSDTNTSLHRGRVGSIGNQSAIVPSNLRISKMIRAATPIRTAASVTQPGGIRR